MAINITNILNAITAKNNNADSTYSSFELSQINRAVNTLNETNGVITYNSASELPSGDSAIIGQIAFIASPYSYDSGDSSISRTGSFYYYNGDSWSIATLASDSDFLNPAVAAGYTFQGTVSGYVAGGNYPTPTYQNIIDKFPFASDGNATDVGDLLAGTGYHPAGNKSSTSGYVSGGRIPGSTNVIQKFPFAVDANATDVGDLLSAEYGLSAASSEFYGYVTSGIPADNVIQKFPFAVDANSADVGDLTVARNYANQGNSSDTYGYHAGGLPGYSTVIDKYPFAVDANATDVGDLTDGRERGSSQSSTDNGYTSGGFTPPTVNIIDKFSFSSDGNATDVGDLTAVRLGPVGTSSDANGYSSGSVSTNVIEKFPFSVDANSADVGDLTQIRYYGTGSQV